MNIVSFAIGALSIVGLIIISLAVIGVVKAYKALKQISDANFALQSFQRDIYQTIDSVERNILDRLDDDIKVTRSYVDSRVDKISAPVKSKPTDVNPQITDAVTQKVLIKD